ncbi:MAG: leucine--tRNA ligase [Halobacteriovoraceae bacterium]|nr:leucine--tRNA ligase [Halobacteriovoraceae bacterium]MCB9095504.1 leucine--tRNA ligase [Halobacteriovoraceae bacterium]
MNYLHREIEKKWQNFWEESKVFEVSEDSPKPKYYVLDMFPYPSGAGLHVGHPLGYIASDVITRYKRLCGFNVLHPMGYDAFGLPAEQYAIKTGQHPAITTDANIKTYRKQLEGIGLSFDWSREVRTCDPSYYKHTQWVFLQLFQHWYDRNENKARGIDDLVRIFERDGNGSVQAVHSCESEFESEQWKSFDEETQQKILLDYRLAYLADMMVNWCPELGTVLANDEVKEGLSVRGGYPVEQKKMKQWCLRITAYAQRLLDGLEKIDWPEPLKEMQRNWIGRSEGAELDFPIEGLDESFKIFTTRPDTIFGVTFMVLAPEHDLIEQLTTKDQAASVQNYLKEVSKKTERERIAETKKVSGVFSGSYCLHPFTNKKIPIWIADYVLGGYGTGAIMAVPAGDSRDYAFAKHFDLEIIPLVEGVDISEESHDVKEGIMMNSDFLNGLEVKVALKKIIDEIEKKKIGHRKVNYKLRDAIFSRQRYWGEPIPIFYKNGIAYPMDEKDLPLELPDVDAYLPTKEGDPPLGRAAHWKTKDGHPIELSTMPGFAGSSAYFLRYMDPKNENELVSKKANQYWKNVDFYVGGSEHATGHLLYSRFWNMFLYDMGEICCEEPFQKLINQGMIQGRSNFVYRVKGTNQYVSHGLKDKYETSELHVDVNIVHNDVLDLEAFKNWGPENKDAEFILEDGQYHCGWGLEKMSKSLYNVVNPDKVIEEYGADTLRLYEMFLGPIEQSKPWNTSGIEGVYRFLNKFWKLCYQDGKIDLEDKEETADEQKIIHKTIKKVKEDLESFSLNTAVSAFMICVNDLGKIKSKNRRVIEKLTVLLSPFAPHLCEQVWHDLGNKGSISFTDFPDYDEKYLVESHYSYPISVNGKMKFLLDLPLDYSKAEIEKTILEDEKVKALFEGKTLKKVIVVPKKIVNLVVG